jgi:hypothetical protein
VKVLKAIAILILGPLLGVLIAFVAGALALRPDPNFAKGGHAAPGDGFLIMLFLGISLLVSVPISIAAAFRVFFRKPSPENPV